MHQRSRFELVEASLTMPADLLEHCLTMPADLLEHCLLVRGSMCQLVQVEEVAFGLLPPMRLAGNDM